MAKVQDYLYEDAPLVEVIAEVRWRLLPISSMPGAEIDPLFERGLNKARAALAELGFSNEERLVPADVPIEFLAGKPMFRYRPDHNQWPLVQLGPGLLTVNVTPPYEGWADFRKSIAAGVGVADDVFGFTSQMSIVRSCEVRYIDAFTERHGMHDPTSFLAEELSMPVSPPMGVLEKLQRTGSAVLPNVKFQFPIQDRDHDTMLLSAFHGTHNGRDAVIYDLRMLRSAPPETAMSGEDILRWMDEAHECLHHAFEGSVSEKLRSRFGDRRAVKE